MTPDQSSDDVSLGSEESDPTGSDSGESPDFDNDPGQGNAPSATATGSQTGEQDFGQSQQGPTGSGRSGDGQLREFLRRQFALQMENVIPEDLQSILDKVEQRLESLRESEQVEFTDNLYGRVRLAGRMLRASAEGSFQLPWKSAASIAAGLTYIVNPLDFLPGILKGEEAVLDDALVLYLCYTVVEQDLNEFLRTHDLDPEEFGMNSGRRGF